VSRQISEPVFLIYTSNIFGEVGKSLWCLIPVGNRLILHFKFPHVDKVQGRKGKSVELSFLSLTGPPLFFGPDNHALISITRIPLNPSSPSCITLRITPHPEE